MKRKRIHTLVVDTKTICETLPNIIETYPADRYDIEITTCSVNFNLFYLVIWDIGEKRL